jgi:hypothetical protein
MDYTACHKNDVFVDLNDREYDEAVAHGKHMYAHSQKSGLRDYINKTKGERAQILGSVCERAVAKALGIYWTAWIDTFHKSDLPFNIEVRLIGVDNYGMQVYDKDDDSRRVVGIIMEKGKERKPYRIPGWINAKYAKQKKWRMDPNWKGHPFYGVPQQKLHHIDHLKRLIGQEMIQSSSLKK